MIHHLKAYTCSFQMPLHLLLYVDNQYEKNADILALPLNF